MKYSIFGYILAAVLLGIIAGTLQLPDNEFKVVEITN